MYLLKAGFVRPATPKPDLISKLAQLNLNNYSKPSFRQGLPDSLEHEVNPDTMEESKLAIPGAGYPPPCGDKALDALSIFNRKTGSKTKMENRIIHK